MKSVAYVVAPALAAVLMAGTSALAQERAPAGATPQGQGAVAPVAPPGQAATAQESEPATPASAAVGRSSEQGTEVGEVIVTAQRRNQRAIDVPATVNLVTSETIENAGIRSTAELAQVVPGLNISPQGYAFQPTIRGVGSSITTPGSTGTVGTYIDGVYQVAQGAANTDLGNIQRVEVLKGPQGTLYGRNATGGVILITTAAPSFTPSGTIDIAYGNYNDLRASIYATGPISDRLAGNISIGYESRDGWFRDIVRNRDLGDVDRWNIRTRLLFRVSESASINFNFAHYEISDPTAFETAPIAGNTTSRRLSPTTPIPSRPYDVALTFDPYIYNIGTQASISTDFLAGPLRVTTITAYNDNHTKFLTDPDFSPLPTSSNFQSINERVVSQEVNFASQGENRLSYIFGFLYVYENAELDPYISAPVIATATSIIRSRTRNDALSAFGELTYQLTDRITLIGGTRYTREARSVIATRNAAPGFSADTVDAEWTPRLSVRYNVTDDVRVYATYSRGFRSGGWNPSTLNPIGYNPEFVTAYEVGVNAQPTSRIRLTAAAFYYDFTDIQFSASTTSIGGGSTTTVVNAASAEIKGVEVTGSFRLIDGLNIDAGLAYTDGTYVSFPNAIVTTPIITATGPAGNTQFVRDVSGNRLIRTPEWTANVGFTYTRDIGVGELNVSGNAAYQSEIYRDALNRIVQEPQTVVNGEIGFRPEGSNYRVSLYARNLFDERYYSQTTDNAVGDRAAYAAPRQYGVRLVADF